MGHDHVKSRAGTYVFGKERLSLFESTIGQAREIGP